MVRRTTKNGPGDKDKKKKSTSKANDTISPYYAAVKYGSSLEKNAAKKSMAGYFSGSPANKRGESESQHMSRMAKKDTIPSARKARGVYQAGNFGPSIGKKASSTVKKKK
jgi:hypothetical protein